MKQRFLYECLRWQISHNFEQTLLLKQRNRSVILLVVLAQHWSVGRLKGEQSTGCELHFRDCTSWLAPMPLIWQDASTWNTHVHSDRPSRGLSCADRYWFLSVPSISLGICRYPSNHNQELTVLIMFQAVADFVILCLQLKYTHVLQLSIARRLYECGTGFHRWVFRRRCWRCGKRKN